jgi:hypothetical protein
VLCPLSVGRCRGRLGVYNHKAKLPGDHDRGACGLETSSCTSGAIAVPSCAFGPLCAFGPRRQGASVGRRRRSLKLAPLGRPKTTAGAAQAPPVDQKDRLPQAARPPPRQPGHSSTAACASVGRHVSQSKTARWGLFSQSARVGSPRAQQHGGVRFCMAPRQTARAQQHGGARFHRAAMAPRQQPEHNSTAGRASAGAAMTARAQQHGGVRVGRGHVSQRKTARRGLLSQQGAMRGPRATPVLPVALGGWFFCRGLCQPRPAL